MTFSEEQVEWIVMEVIRRLGLLERVREDDSNQTGSCELIVNEKVVTMRTIEGKLDGVRRLVVPSRAVITPSVRDELKRRQIEFVSNLTPGRKRTEER